jgi:hypothetical protein
MPTNKLIIRSKTFADWFEANLSDYKADIANLYDYGIFST